MKKFLCVFSLLMAITVTAFAQMQQGVVKTRGRMVNGKYVSGSGLTGAIVSIQGGNSYRVQDSNGSFSFPVPTKTFVIQRVQKSGYQLVDADLIRKSFQYSGNPLCLVMETPEQLMEDKLTAERKIRRTLQHQLEEKEGELEALKAQQRLTQEEYQKKLQRLYDEQKDNEKLISEMAQRYTELDYDQMDDLNRRISDCILNGELTRADSLLRTKGDIRQRMEELHQHQQANEGMRDKLEKSEAMAEKEKEELAEDCFNRFSIFRTQHMNDSAAYYLELRASLDTTDVSWQNDAGEFIFQYLSEDAKALNYFERALRHAIDLSEGKDDDDVAENYLCIASVLNNLGEQDQAIEYCQKALDMYQSLYGEDDNDVSLCLNIMGLIYSKKGDYLKAFDYYEKSLDIRLGWDDDGDIAASYINIAQIGNEYGMYDDALELYKRALAHIDQLTETNRATLYNNIALTYSSLDNNEKAIEYLLKAIGISEVEYGKDHPETAFYYKNIGSIYYETEQYELSKSYLNKALDIYTKFYGSTHAMVSDCLIKMGTLYRYQDNNEEALKYYKQALDIDLALWGEEHLKTASAYSLMGSLYYDWEKYDEALSYYTMALHIRTGLLQDIEHPVWDRSLYNMAKTLEALGDECYDAEKNADALKHYQNGLEFLLLREKEPDVSLARAYKHIGNAYYNLEDYIHAVEFFLKSLDVRLAVNGEGNAKTAYVCKDVADTYKKLGEQDKARDYYQKAYNMYQKAEELDDDDIEDMKTCLERMTLLLK